MPAAGRGVVVSTGLRDRLTERRRALVRLRTRRVAYGVVGAVVAVAAVWALLFSPLLGLRLAEVRVTGSDGTVSAAQVRSSLASQEGRSLLRMDLRATGRQVSDSLVRVRSATVTRRWPHGLSVAVQMRQPVAVLEAPGGFQVLDGDAVVLETVSTPPASLVRITLPPAQQAAQPADGSPDAQATASPSPDAQESAATPVATPTPQAPSLPTGAQVRAVARAAGMLDARVRSMVASGSASAAGQVSFELTSGAHVVWGDERDGELKAQVLGALLRRQASVYDVSSPRSPTTR